MASIASSTAPSSSSHPESPRPQAGPLPTKRGEIGYQEQLHGHHHDSRRISSPMTTPLPARHPADRDAPPEENASSSNHATPSSNDNPSSTPSPSSRSSPGGDTSPSVKRNRLFGIFNRKNNATFGGLYLKTLIAFTIQLLVLGGTIAIWVLAGKRLVGRVGSSGVISSAIFIHVVFAVAAVGQILFIERRIYRMRAERYSYLHPGEILPSSRRLHREFTSDPVIAFSPWNRPPLPTYAAALAQSGVGTGDVEDHLIAAPPPPAYGNTRGSILLLSGFLRDSLRAQRPSSIRSGVSVFQERNGNDRPVSYVSRNSTLEFVEDAERARRLDETLARLERPASRDSRTSPS